MLPRKVKFFQLFVDGRGYAGEGEEFTVPKLTRKMEEYRAGGMQGPIDIDLGVEKIEADFTLGEYNEDIMRQWGICDNAGVKLRLMASTERDDQICEVTPHEIVMHGRWKEIDSGTWKGGDSSTMKVSVTISYLKWIINGDDFIEIDLPNVIFVVDGEDRLLIHRQAIGMTY